MSKQPKISTSFHDYENRGGQIFVKFKHVIKCDDATTHVCESEFFRDEAFIEQADTLFELVAFTSESGSEQVLALAQIDSDLLCYLYVKALARQFGSVDEVKAHLLSN